ncbi:MAG: M24 family metallopeptidase [Armatimonadota bacterium]
MLKNKDEITEKENRIRALMDKTGLGAIALSTVANFAWFTCGGSNYVGIASENGVATAIVTKDSKYIICNNIEEKRIAEEVVPGQGFEFITCLWYEEQKELLVKEIIGNRKLGADSYIAGAVDVCSDLDACRCNLTEPEIMRYEALGQDVGECLLLTARRIRPGMTENQVAGILDGELRSRGIVPIVTLVAADERAKHYRHPLPTNKPIDRYVMLVTGALRWGLVVSATRIICFGRIPDELRTKHEAVVRIDAEMIAATKVGTTMGEVLRKAIAAYAREGYPQEWKLHHQGGPTGYKSRDFRVKPDTETRVCENQAFAWNPSISGTKSEDTIIVTKAGPKIISLTAEWPKAEVEINGQKIPRPEIFVL